MTARHNLPGIYPLYFDNTQLSPGFIRRSRFVRNSILRLDTSCHLLLNQFPRDHVFCTVLISLPFTDANYMQAPSPPLFRIRIPCVRGSFGLIKFKAIFASLSPLLVLSPPLRRFTRDVASLLPSVASQMINDLLNLLTARPTLP